MSPGGRSQPNREEARLDVADMLLDEYINLHGPCDQGYAEQDEQLVRAQAQAQDENKDKDEDKRSWLDDRLRAFYAQVHALPVPRSALCLSGGGIRSASFSLGVMQALAVAGVLDKFHYLSSVSGGGYIGSWLTAWIHRCFTADGTTRRQPRTDLLGDVRKGLAMTPGADEPRRRVLLTDAASWAAGRPDSPGVGGDQSNEPQQVAHLRRFTSYLSPQSGILSLDTWTLIAIYLRNLILNWLVVVPLLAVVLAVPYMVAGLLWPILHSRLGLGVEWIGPIAVFGPSGLALVAFAVEVAWSVAWAKFERVRASEKRARVEALLLQLAVAWTALAGVALYGPKLLAMAPRLLTLLGGVSGVATYILKKLGSRAPRTTAGSETPERTLRVGTSVAAVLTLVPIVALLATGVGTVIAGIWGVSDPLQPPTHGAAVAPALFAAGALSVSALFALFIDINEFSLHGLYRNRLVRAFLRASRGAEAPADDNVFDPKDDIDLADLWPRRPDPGEVAEEAPHLFHVINATLNDVGGSRSEWRERKGVSFTFSPLHFGAHIVGRRRGEERCGGYRRLRRRDLSTDSMQLGTAMTISGAAVSPNMGYHSSAFVTFLMALFNVRLGWWMRAPWLSDPATSLPRTPFSVWRAWAGEALGRTRANASVINVSDGGHFDNLGLYEMVRRRCRHIVVVDAGEDRKGEFESLGEAVRKIRVDFGVSISMVKLDISGGRSGSEKGPAVHAWHGTIGYSSVDSMPDGSPAPDGELIYLKPVVAGDEEIDVQAYRRLHPAFPHESTVDQWFRESQFESYRRLGEHTVRHLIDYYHAAKGQLASPVPPGQGGESALPPRSAPTSAPALFCHQIAEALALRQHSGRASSHAGGVVYLCDDTTIRFLLVRSVDRTCRVIPKGRIETWEDAATTATREVREETGFVLAPERGLGLFPFTRGREDLTAFYFLMQAKTSKADFLPYEEYRSPAWFAVDEARRANPPAPPDVVAVLEKALELVKGSRMGAVARVTHAGGLVYRLREGGVLEFLLVRSTDGAQRVLPKGHIDDGETAREAAAREVREEAGLDLHSERELGTFSFPSGAGEVHTTYFLMNAGDAEGLGGEAGRDPRWFATVDAAGSDLPVPTDVLRLLDLASKALQGGSGAESSDP